MWLALIPSKVISIHKDFLHRNDTQYKHYASKSARLFWTKWFHLRTAFKATFLKLRTIMSEDGRSWPKHVACIVEYKLIGMSDSNREIAIALNCYLSIPTDLMK
jgi:hypothetical protein